MMSLWDLDAAVAELEWVLGRGGPRSSPCALGPNTDAHRPTRTSTPSGPGSTRPEARWPSISPSRATTRWCPLTGGYEPNPSNFTMSAWQWTNCYGDRPIMETLSALVFEKLLRAVPQHHRRVGGERRRMGPLSGAAYEQNAGAWAATAPGSAAALPARPPRDLRPARAGHPPTPRTTWPPSFEDMGADSIVLGSDWPHAEGLPQPADFIDQLETLPAGDQRKIMRDNGLRLVT